MTICRVLTRPDGGVSVVHPNLRARREDESDAAHLARATPEELRGLPFVDMDSEDLPPRREPCPDADCDEEHPVRDQWRMVDGGPQIDRALPNLHADLAHAQRDLAAELDKPAPNPVTVAQLDLAVRRARDGMRPVRP